MTLALREPGLHVPDMLVLSHQVPCTSGCRLLFVIFIVINCLENQEFEKLPCKISRQCFSSVQVHQVSGKWSYHPGCVASSRLVYTAVSGRFVQKQDLFSFLECLVFNFLVAS